MTRPLALLAAAPLLAAAAGWHLGLAPPAPVPAGAPDRAPGPVWVAPLPGPLRVTRGFEPPPTPYAAGNRGVDLAGRPGEPVRAAGAGVVGFAGVVAGTGVVTVVHADGLKTTYEPVLAGVRTGTRVGPGRVLGRLLPGRARCPVAACLHWGLLDAGGTYRDPLLLLRRGPPRLLPLR
ncbi:MAG TPA: peptidoglycan DD-metalloendopeptidase family protein [Mycobacteriales bacterium]|nr:peptidoglycan DD-metalloendopeptidase family protein [Mycobacteriales bacterium]